MLDVSEKKILMIGAGKACAEKLRGLQAAGVEITLIAPTREDAFLDKPWIHYEKRKYKRGDLEGYDVVYMGVNDTDTKNAIIKDAAGMNILINIVDDPGNSDFISPAMIKMDHFAVFISTYGKGPGMTKKIRQTLEKEVNLRQLDIETKQYIEARNARLYNNPKKDKREPS